VRLVNARRSCLDNRPERAVSDFAGCGIREITPLVIKQLLIAERQGCVLAELRREIVHGWAPFYWIPAQA
jgi:hypothetical protein